MRNASSPKRSKFKLYAVASASAVAVGATAALMAGVTPATAATIVHQPDAQVAVFMVPLTILVLAILFETARVVLRGNLPVEAPSRRSVSRYWNPDRDA